MSAGKLCVQVMLAMTIAE